MPKVKIFVCGCGTEIETTSANRKYCPECRKQARRERYRAWYQTPQGKEYHKAWQSKNPDKLEEYKAKWKLKQTPPSKKSYDELYPLRTVTCALGCGAMIETRSRSDKVFCPACRQKHKLAEAARYRASEHGQEVIKRYRQSEAGREVAQRSYAKSKERHARWYEAHKEEVKARRRERYQELKAAGLITPRATARYTGEEQHLPTEKEKLAMLRAAMKRFYGD